MMNMSSWRSLGIGLALLATGCTKKITPVPETSLPGGTTLIQFNRPLQGPLLLTIDGLQIPVQQPAQGKLGTKLIITQLTPGKHTYFLSSAQDALSPDQGELNVTPGHGCYVMTLVHPFYPSPYGKPELPAPGDNLTSFKARMEK